MVNLSGLAQTALNVLVPKISHGLALSLIRTTYIRGQNALTRDLAIARLARALVSPVMMVLRAKELFVQITAMAVDTVFLKRFLPQRLDVYTLPPGMLIKM